MKKKLFTLLVCAFAWISVNAQTAPRYSVSTDADGYVVITKYASDGTTVAMTASDAQNLDREVLNKSGEGSTISNATKLKLVGYFSDYEFTNVLKVLNQKVVDLDLSGAMLDQSTVDENKGYYIKVKENNQDVIYTVTHDETDNTYYYMKDDQKVYVEEKDVEDNRKVSGGQRIPSDWQNTLTTISLPTSPDFKNIGNDFCNGLNKITSITIPSNIEVIGENAFTSCTAMKSVTFSSTPDNPCKLKLIGYHSFYQTDITQVSIPATVEFVGIDAFGVITGLTKIVFADVQPGEVGAAYVTVKANAFNNSKNITDVYIENTFAKIDCDNGAFDFDNTWAHGDPTAATATLHFPQKYASNYANLGHPLTMEAAGTPAKFHDWLMEHYSQAQTAINGWYEFRNNGTIDPDPGAPTGNVNKFLRTYCDMDNDRLVPEGVKAYIVNSINTTTYEITLKQLFAIPKGTGVILYGEPNSKDKNGNKILSMNVCQIKDSQPLCRKDDGTFEEEDGNYWINYLVPTGKDGVNPGPYEADGNTVTYRNFCLGRNSLRLDEHTSNPYVGFFRLQPGMMSGGKAYLKLSATEYPYSTGGEVIVIGDTKTMQGYGIMHYQVEYDKTQGTPIGPETSGYWKGGASDGETVKYGDSTVSRPNMYWAKDSNWGNRGETGTAHIAMFFGEPEATGINGAVVNSLEDGTYYTVEGVKTTNPQKGIYIKNGKKVVIK